MSIGTRVVTLVGVLGVLVAGSSCGSQRDTPEARVRALIERSLDGAGEVELGPLMRQQDASSLIVICPYWPTESVEADTGIRITRRSNESQDGSVDLVFAAGSEVRSIVTLRRPRYDVCLGLPDNDDDVVPVFGPDAVLSAKKGDSSSGRTEILVSLTR